MKRSQVIQQQINTNAAEQARLYETNEVDSDLKGERLRSLQDRQRQLFIERDKARMVEQGVKPSIIV